MTTKLSTHENAARARCAKYMQDYADGGAQWHHSHLFWPCEIDERDSEMMRNYVLEGWKNELKRA